MSTVRVDAAAKEVAMENQSNITTVFTPLAKMHS